MAKQGVLSPDQVTSLDPDAGLSSMHKTMESFIATADVEAVYGKPVKSGDTIIIPTAEVICGMGFGYGLGSYEVKKESEAEASTTAENQETPPPGQGSGSGGGGGGYTFSRPVALVIATPEGVRVEPIFDRTKILLAALTTAGFMLSMCASMMKSKR